MCIKFYYVYLKFRICSVNSKIVRTSPYQVVPLLQGIDNRTRKLCIFDWVLQFHNHKPFLKSTLFFNSRVKEKQWCNLQQLRTQTCVRNSGLPNCNTRQVNLFPAVKYLTILGSYYSMYTINKFYLMK